MKLIGQRWRYRIGNSLVLVDNAFSWSMWSQERIIVNDETVTRGGGYWRIRNAFRVPWLTMLGDSELQIKGFGRLNGIEIAVMLDGERQQPEQLLNATWQGARHDWPDDIAWQSGTLWIVEPSRTS